MSGHVERDAWKDALARSTPDDVLTVEVPIMRSPRGGSGTFLAECSDGQRWWIKPPNHGQGGKVLISEYVVGQLGGLIGAPVCEVSLAVVPDDIAGWEFRDNKQLEPGYACGSRNVGDAFEVKNLQHCDDDDNDVRHVGVLALFDWCWGGDGQWLYSRSADNETYSHDHGWYFPETGADWTEDALISRVDEPHELAHNAEGLDSTAVSDVADALESINRAQICGILNTIPSDWPATDEELEALGFFIERRAPAVAERLRSSTNGEASS